jgi:hypothetical protein
MAHVVFVIFSVTYLTMTDVVFKLIHITKLFFLGGGHGCEIHF